MRVWPFRKYCGDHDVAIDLGTANTRLYVLDRGVVAEEPTTIQREGEGAIFPSGTGWAAGCGSAGDVAPLRRGVVNDVDATARLLDRLFGRVRGLGAGVSRAIVCAPSNATATERFDLLEALRRTGVARAKVLPAPWASAVGAGLDVASPYGQMLVDIGDGVTDVAVIRAREIMFTTAARRGAGDLRSALQQAVMERQCLFLPHPQAEGLIRSVGVFEPRSSSAVSVVAFDPAGTPLRIALSSQDVLQAIHPMMREILDLIVCTLDQLPPELWVEVIESGISLAGGGACLRGIDRLVARATSAEVKLAPNPLRATIEGAGEILAAARQAGLWDTLW